MTSYIDKKLLDGRKKYAPELIAKWHKMLKSGEIDPHGIEARWGIKPRNLAALMRDYELQNTTIPL